MGLSEEDIAEIAKACSKSRTLLAIHLTGNQISPEQRAEIRTMLKPRKRIKNFAEHVEEPDSDDHAIGTYTAADKIQHGSPKTGPKEKTKDLRRPQEKTGTSHVGDESLVYSRVLGHFEMPHSHRWSEAPSCWICEKHAYTVILASKSICEDFYEKPMGKDCKKYQKRIETAAIRREETFKTNNLEQWGSDNDEIYYDAEVEDYDKVPDVKEGKPAGKAHGAESEKEPANKYEYYRNNQLVGAFTGWRCKSMIPLYAFIRRLYKNSQPAVRVVPLGKESYEQEIKEFKVRK